MRWRERERRGGGPVKRNWLVLGVIGLTSLVYAGSIIAGLRLREWSMPSESATKRQRMDWTPPPQSSIPNDASGDGIRRGMLLFDETPVFASHFARAKVSCSSCHAEGGIQPYASPVVGVPALFPMYNERAGRVISLKDRIEECFVRSENGIPLEADGPQMRALVAYMEWLSQPQPDRRPFQGRGLVAMPALKPDPAHGAEIYAAQCAGCHGDHGEGKPPLFPPVWGPDSFNDGAGMNGVPKMAAFVQRNMPQNRMGVLTPQEAYDVSAFIHSQPRPAFNPAYKSF